MNVGIVMPSNPLFIFIAIVAAPMIASGLVHEVRHWRFKRALYAREDATANWRARFPDAMPEADRVLTIFCDAFMLRDRCKRSLRPDDRVMEIYKNTTGPWGDAMQLERLGMSIDDEFRVDLLEGFNELLVIIGRDVETVVLFGQALGVENAALAHPRVILGSVADDVDS